MSDKYQEIFDTVWNGLKSQGFQKSVGEIGICQYRGVNGMKCAAGWLIPDEDYNESWDRMRARVTRVSFFKKFKSTEFAFIECLQNAHDSGDDPEKMKKHLLSSATVFIRNFDRSKYV